MRRKSPRRWIRLMAERTTRVKVLTLKSARVNLIGPPNSFSDYKKVLVFLELNNGKKLLITWEMVN